MKKDEGRNFAPDEQGQLHKVRPEETGEIPDTAAWLDETGEIPNVTAWLDETGEIPDAAEWLDETGEIPNVTAWPDETGEIPNVTAWLDETGEIPAAAEWLDETEELPAAAEFTERWTPGETDALRDSGENPGRFGESAGDSSILRLSLKDWDDTLDEEPAGWFETGRIRKLRAGSEGASEAADTAETPGVEEVPEAAETLGVEEVPEAAETLGLEEMPEAAEHSGMPDRSAGPEMGLPRLRACLQEKRTFAAAAAGLGVLILLAGTGAGLSTAGSRRLQQQRETLAAVSELLPGDQALNTEAVNRLAELRIQGEEEAAAREEAARQKAEREAEQDEAEGSVAVNFTLSTIQSDLKIKIRRQKEQSLIGGVPFTVKIKGPNGTTTEQTDEDEDGIIYLTGLANGKYEVALCSLLDLDEIKQQDDYRENEDYVQYSRYSLSDQAQTIEVTDHIAYEVVDVSDEVKSASEVNAAKEDTARNDTPVESTIKDTVEWVESTKTEITEEGGEASYTEVARKDVPDPYAAAALSSGSFRRLSEVSTEDETDSRESGTGTGEESSGEGTSEGGETSGETSDGGNSEGENTDSTGEEKEAAQPQLKTDPSEIHLAAGGTQSIKATVTGASDTTVSYRSSDTDVATVSDGGTVQGVKAGSCTITVSLREYENVTQTVSVTVSEKTDDSTPLKDADGNPLYVKENDTYRAATAGDYSRHDVFYRKTVTEKKYRYTGWQHINGLTYYYDRNGTPVTGAQIIQGVSYTFSSEGILDTGSTNAGIDVSMWNGSIRWSEVASSGISFAIVRCGYRGSSTGALVKDSAVGTNVTGARNAGLKVGLYFFSQAVNEAEAVEEASMAVQIAKSYGISMPIFLDVESSGGRGDAVSVSQRTANIAAFCKTVQNAGFSAGVYANTNWFSEKINVSTLTGYHIWLAQYAETPTYSGSRYDIWQYSSTGRVNGISGNVDLNISYRAF